MRMNPGTLIETYAAAFTAGDIDAVIGLHTPDAVIHGVFGWGSVAEVAAPVWRELHACLQMRLSIESLVAQGSTVVARYLETGRSVAEFRGRPATGRSYELIAMEWYELRDGLIARRWGARDAASQARQLGWE
jgi:steroid delta-isomerase-like uncharacterized protein